MQDLSLKFSLKCTFKLITIQMLTHILIYYEWKREVRITIVNYWAVNIGSLVGNGHSRSFLFFFFVAGTVQVVSCPGPHRAGQVRGNEINSILPSWPKGYNKTCNYANIYSYSVKKKVVRYQDALHELVDLCKWFDKIVYQMIRT